MGKDWLRALGYGGNDNWWPCLSSKEADQKQITRPQEKGLGCLNGHQVKLIRRQVLGKSPLCRKEGCILKCLWLCPRVRREHEDPELVLMIKDWLQFRAIFTVMHKRGRINKCSLWFGK